MNEEYIVTSYVFLDDGLKAMGHQDDVRSQISAAEVLTVAVVAAKYFQNHLERALCILQRLGDIGRISVSRFNRRIHQLSRTLNELLEWLQEQLCEGAVFVIDSTPLPVCRSVRATRCQKVRGKAFNGFCAVKDWHYFGFKLHLLCRSDGIPIAFVVLPASQHDLTPVHELTVQLPPEARVVGDKAYNSDEDENFCFFYGRVHLIPRHKRNMNPNTPEEKQLLQQYRPVIETLCSRLEKMGVQRLQARTSAGFFLKVHASLLALALTAFSSN